MNSNKILGEHSFVFSPSECNNQLSLLTKFIANGDPITSSDGIFLNQYLTLDGEANNATLNLFIAQFTPDELRRLANELESAEAKIRAKFVR